MIKIVSKNILKGIFARSIGKQQIDYLKQDIGSIQGTAKIFHTSFTQKEKHIDDWNNFVTHNNINYMKVRNQYQARRYLALLCLVIFLFSLVCLALSNHFFSAPLAGALVSGTFYLVHALRLFQMRHRCFCSFGNYFHSFRREFKQLLPLALPYDWTLLNNFKGEDTHVTQ